MTKQSSWNEWQCHWTEHGLWNHRSFISSLLGLEKLRDIHVSCHRVCMRGRHLTEYPPFKGKPLANSSLPRMQIPSGYYLQTMNSNRNLGGFPLPIALMNAISILPLLILAPFMDYCSNHLLSSERDGPLLSAYISKYNTGFWENCLQVRNKKDPSYMLLNRCTAFRNFKNE